ncbi:hypothetical protein PY254_17710 [Rhodanobacter sp. AS-Z3]|uniref:hypothetical protein n=1 Tax=Rhodanobacter sp. AS-Z3 TaxID=3031330 RepID=UPI002478BB70|nr:hypothetical protein [Rhodanobacter sp. AS-Z3]WEN15040.1 hypothetical protein PY254_17710 [Rhodanobacter sp. AS-Z3]
MNRKYQQCALAVAVMLSAHVMAAAALLVLSTTVDAQNVDRQEKPAAHLITANPSGRLQTSNAAGLIDPDNPFFASLGSNGRSCSSCHRQKQGWALSADEVRERFEASKGRDPLFALIDAAVTPLADTSTLEARRAAYAMLLSRGVLRVGIPMPAKAEFQLTAVDDPYGYASARELSLFRRPLPATNLIWVTSVMWDGRETYSPFEPPMDAGLDFANVQASLTSQAIHAIVGHEQATSMPDPATIARIVDFESHLFTAQYEDNVAGRLNNGGGMGGASILAQQRFWVGINDVLGKDPTQEPFDAKAMRLFDDWQDEYVQPGATASHVARASIARGEQLFNNLPMAITGVAGLNDVTGQAVFQGTCSSCHNSPNIGNQSVAQPMNIGTAGSRRRSLSVPLYTLTRFSTGEVVQTTDPGVALITGKWADIGKFKGPTLRGLAARPPYFHDGSATTLMDVVNFYNGRFAMHLTDEQKGDLVAFLGAL